MDIHAATEQAYRNGYEAGKRDAETKWIPTAEKMPDDFVSVLVHIPSDEPMPTVKEAYHAGRIWITRDGCIMIQMLHIGSHFPMHPQSNPNTSPAQPEFSGHEFIPPNRENGLTGRTVTLQEVNKRCSK